jgi:hypothetical protein
VFRYSHNLENLDISSHLLITKLHGGENTPTVCEELEKVLLDEWNIEEASQSPDQTCHVLNTLLCPPRNPQSHLSISRLFSNLCSSWWEGSWDLTVVSRSLPSFPIMN